MKTIFHPASERGFANHGWLKAAHSFSFANYFDRDKVHFGMLRVLNDDIIGAGEGFGTHPHDNMEIITIPLHGSLEHKDSMGNGSLISTGEIQNMSAGAGITHSEFNPRPDSETNILQIWIFPEIRDITPRYGQLRYDEKSLVNSIVNYVAPEKHKDKLWINQQAWISLSKPSENFELMYQPKKENNGLYIFIIEGEVESTGYSLKRRDALGIWNAEDVKITAKKDSFLLLLEVPMNTD
ncbi:MAG: pirin family protein [Bacteroidales bacterium]|nr:pirin family protein [Bacteroidales bacterium]